MKKLITNILLATFVTAAPCAMGARGEVKAAATPPVIKPAEGIPPEQPKPSPTAHPGVTSDPPATFDPSQFGAITTESLPLVNGEPVVMRVNGRPVTWTDFDIQASMAGAALLKEHPGEEAGVLAALAPTVTEGLIVQELFREFATSHSLTVHPSEVQRRMEEVKSARDPSTRSKIATLTDSQIQQLMKDNLIREKVTKYLGDVATSTPPTLEELTSFTVNMQPTTSPVTLTRASHIVLRATPDMSEFQVNDAKAKADEVLQKIRAGLDFSTAARQYSQDRFTAYQGGNVGYFAPGQMYPTFEAAAAKLQPGQVSDVVRTPVGFHIIQVTERHNDDLRLHVDKYKKQMAVQQWLTNTAEAARVENYLGK